MQLRGALHNLRKQKGRTLYLLCFVQPRDWAALIRDSLSRRDDSEKRKPSEGQPRAWADLIRNSLSRRSGLEKTLP